MWSLSAYFDFDGNFLKFGGYEDCFKNGGYKRKGIWMIKDSKHEKFFTRYDFGNGNRTIQTPKEKQDQEILIFEQQQKEQAE